MNALLGLANIRKLDDIDFHLDKTHKIRQFVTTMSDDQLGHLGIIIAKPGLDSEFGNKFRFGKLMNVPTDEVGNLPWLTSRDIFQNRHYLENHQYKDWLTNFEQRIATLLNAAEQDGIKFNDSSLSLARGFAKSSHTTVMPSVFLLDNGNIRFLWAKNEDQIGLQFLENGSIQYVISIRDARHFGLFVNERSALKLLSAIGCSNLLGQINGGNYISG